MPIEVEGPGGVVAEFPENTPRDVIVSAMQRRFGAPQTEAGTPQQDPLATPPSGLDAIRQQPTVPGVVSPKSIVDWVDRNLMTPEGRQNIYDMIGQSLGAAGGIAAGTPAGPAGQIGGGAAGAVIGKKAARYLGGAEQPGAGESLADAAGGAAGPVVSGTVQAARPLIRRVFAGGTAEVKAVRDASQAAEAAKAAADAAKAEAAQKGVIARAIPSEENIDATVQASIDAGKAGKAVPKTQAEFEAAYKAAVKGAVDNGAPLTQSTIGMLTGGALLLGTPLAALGTFIGGEVASGAHAMLARKLLSTPAFIKWSLEHQGLSSRTQIATSLGTLMAEKGLSEDERGAIGELRSSLAPSTREAIGNMPAFYATEGSRLPMLRDGAGRFARKRAIGPSDNATLQEMFPDINP